MGKTEKFDGLINTIFLWSFYFYYNCTFYNNCISFYFKWKWFFYI